MTSLQNDGWKNRQEDIDDERKAQGITSLQKESEWEKEFEKVMGCIPECATGLYEDVGCPAHGYDAIKAIKFFRGVLSNREKEIAEEVKKMKSEGEIETNLLDRQKVLQILKH